MFALFPNLFFLSPLTTTLLRAAAAIVILLLAWNHWQRRDELSRIDFIVIGRGAWIPILAALIEALIGLALLIGIYTQAAAILGALLSLKEFVWHRRYAPFFPLSRTTSVLLFVICISLIVTGAGAFAIDMPL